MYQYGNLDRVGWGPQLVGVQTGPAIVGAAPGMVPGAMPPGAGPGPGPMPGGPMMPHPGDPRLAHHRWAHRHQFYPYPAGAWPASTPYAYSGYPHIVNTPPTQVREFVIGFGPQNINLMSTAIFQAQPQLIFRGSRLVIPSTVANSFLIADLRVGKDSQAVSSNPVPAAVFSELAVGVNLGLDTAHPGIIISLSISNPTGAPQTFSAALIGTSMQ